MCHRLLLCAVVAALGVAQSPARAGDVETCEMASDDEAKGIAACTRLITSGRYKGSDLANLYYYRGLKWSEKEAERAVADFSQAINLDPKGASAPVYYGARGRTWSGKGDNVRAIADYSEAIKIDPRYEDHYLNRGIAYAAICDVARARADFATTVKKDGTWAEKAKDWLAALDAMPDRSDPIASDATFKDDDVIAACTKLLESDPRNEGILRWRAFLYKSSNKVDLAIKDRTTLIALNPRDPQRYADRAKLYQDDSNYELAIADATKAIELDAQNAVRYADRAHIYEDHDDFDHAISDTTLAIQLDAKNPTRYADRAKLRESNEQFSEAVEDYGSAIKLNPEFAEYRLSRGQLYLDELHDFDRAIADSEAALEIAEKVAVPEKKKEIQTTAYVLRGDANTKKGDRAHAIEDYRRTIEAAADDSQRSEAHLKLGEAYLDSGALDPAFESFGKAIELTPSGDDTRGAALTGRGSVYSAKGDFNHALTDYTQAAKIWPSDAKAAKPLKLRGDLLAARGQLGGAIASYTTAIERDGDFVAAYVARGLLYERMGQKAKALDDFRAAVLVPAEDQLNRQAHETAQARLAVLEPLSRPGGAAQVVATPGRRVALVIGNGAYAAMPRLRNPANDATDVAAVLKNLGFEVTLGTDVKRSDMEDDLIRFAREARQSEVALVYFAGHGLQHNGINYLVPVDSRIEEEGDLRRLIEVQSVIEDLRAGHGARILILDACRDNGVAQQVASLLPADRSAAFDRGLGRIDRDTARGTVVVFATQPNRVAKDGSGRNSPFTEALLRQLPSPGVELRTLMTRVRNDVVKNTSGDQWPEVSDSMVGEFVFKAGPDTGR